MILSTAATDATGGATISAAWIALAAALIGVLVTVIGGFLGALLQSRREHERWIRDQRFKLYEEALVLATEATRHMPEPPHVPTELPNARSDLDLQATAIGSRVSLLGPKSVTDAWREFHLNWRQDYQSQKEWVTETEIKLRALRATMRKALDVKYYKR